MTSDTTEPAATGEPDPTATGDDVNAGTVQQDMATGRQLEVRNPYDADVPETLRERIAYARALSQAGVLPRDYQAKPANVLVAGEMGRELGLTNVQAVLMLNVVEGRPTLGASGVRAVILRAGHRVKVTDRQYNGNGIPTSVTVTGWRYDDRYSGREGALEPTDVDDRTYTLDMAKRAGLCTLLTDDAGEVRAVRARSRSDNPLPWEQHTERMLEARATTWLGDTLFADVTMGLSVDRDPDPVAAVITAEHTGTSSSGPAEPTPRAAEVLDRLKPTRRTSLTDDYTPDADLAEAGQTWWEHAGAQVTRRSKVQLAADRLARWVADADTETLSNFPMPPDTAAAEPEASTDAELVPEPDVPADAEPDDVVEAEVVPEPDVPADPEPVVPDPRDGSDPWAPEQPADDVPADTQGHDALPAEGVPDDGPVLDDGPDLGGESTTAELLAVIDAAAEQLGKSRAGLMVRWIATHRKNPEDAEPAELEAFVAQLQPLLDAQRG